MKKLIAMIGAVATAFGLYAAEPAKFATSFEANEPGVEGTTFTPGTGWTWGSEDALTLGTYDGDKYVYGTGAFARRDSEFTVGLDSQVNYLKLETGTNALSRAVGGNVFLDQLVKFTGFEEYQTNVVAGTKIAVWMSGIETEGTAQIGTPQIGTPQIGTPAQGVEGEDGYVPASPDYQPASPDYQPASPDYQPASSDYIAGETNLYITCAKVVDGQVQTNALKIAGSYELDKWYRLTIKSIGDIYDADKRQSEDPRAGFIVYVDGNQVAAVDDAATTLIEYDSEMTAAAKGYMAAKQLFPAIDNTDATFATVGYQGIGAIDDIILDTDGPEFARTVDVTAEALGIQGAKIVKVTQDGEIVTGEGVWKVKAGNIVVWYAPDGAYVFKGDGDATATWTVSGDGAEMVEDSQTFEVAEAVAKIVNVATPTEVTYIDEDDLAELTGLANGDTATILKSCEIQDEEENTLYSFTPNTTISVAEGGIWNIFIDKWVFDNKGVLADKAGELYDNFGLLASKTVNVTFGEKVGNNLCTLYIEGAIAGNITAGDNGVVVINNDGVETTLSGTITAANVEVADDVTLVENGKLITTDDSIESILDGEGIAVVPTADTPEEGWYTYALATEPETYEVMVAEPVEHCTVKVEISDLEPAYEGGKYEAPIDATVVVTYTPDEDYEITDGQAVWTFTAESEVFETTAPSVAQSAPAEAVAKIGDVAYTSLQSAFDAAEAGETVELIDNLTVTTMATMENKDLIFNLGGYTLLNDGADKVISITNSTVVITNGTINGVAGYAVENTGASHITIARDTTIVSSSAYIVFPRGAVVDVYGTITQLNNQYAPCIWASVEGCVINIYDGANLSTPGGDIIRHRCNMPEPSDNAAVVNIYGGTFSGGDVIYGYASGGSVNNGKVNIYGGTFTVNKVYNIAASADLTVRPFDGECSTLKFSKLATGLADACAEGYGLKLVDGWYVIAQLPVVELVNAGNKGTVTLDQTVGTSVAFGGTVSGTVEANEGYTPFVFVDGQKVTVGQDGAFTGIANDSGKVVVAYAKASAWYLDPFVKNDAIVRAVFHPSGLADLAFSPDRTKLFAGIDTYNYSSCYDTYNGVLQYGASDLLSYIGSYSGTPENGYLANATVGYLCGNMEGVRSVIPMTDGVMVGPQQGALGDGIHKNGDNIILPMGGAWGGADEATGLAKEDDDRYFLDLPANDLDNGTVGAFNTHGLQWTIAGVQSTDGNSLYVAFHARNEITKATIGKDSNGKITLTKTGIFWRTWDVVGKNNEYNATALALYNNGEKDFIYAARADGKVFLLDEETASGNEYTNVKTGETVYDKKMIELLDLSANQTEYYGSYNSGKDEYTPSNSGIRSMFVSGVADGTPHLVVQFTCGHTFVFALNPDGSLASTTPIADIDGASLGVMANTTPKEIGEKATGFSAKGLQAAVGTDDETTLVGNYAENGYHLAVITAKPENVIVRGTFGDYEDGENTEFAYGTAAEVVFNAPAGKQITAVKVNGVADANFTPAAYTFTDAALTKNVYVEMTVEPVVAMIGTTGYKTLAAAATAAVDNDTIVLLDDYTLAADENVVFSKKVTLDLGDNTLTIRGDNKAFVIATAADVTLTNGTITGTADYGIKVEGTLTVADIDMDAQGAGPCFDMYATASITVNSGSFLNFHDVFRLTKVDNATPTVVVNGGTYSVTQYGAFYAYKPGCAADITINGGTFETQAIYVSSKGTGFVWSGDKLDDTCKAKFKVIAKHETSLVELADYIAPGYALAKIGGDGEFKDYYQIVAAYNVTIAPTENGTVETSVTNNIVAGTEVTITATPATDYAVDTIAVTNGEEAVTVENNKFLMPAGNVTVYVTFKSTATPGIIPGEEKEVSGTTAAEAQEAADKLPIALTAEQEAAGLKTEYFHNLVKPNTAGDGFVAYVEVKEELAPQLDTTTEDDPIEVDATNFSATISNAKKGLYYGFKAVDALGTTATFEPVGEFKTPDESGSLTISAPKGEGNARFYKLTVSITDLTPVTD